MKFSLRTLVLATLVAPPVLAALLWAWSQRDDFLTIPSVLLALFVLLMFVAKAYEPPRHRG